VVDDCPFLWHYSTVTCSLRYCCVHSVSFDEMNVFFLLKWVRRVPLRGSNGDGFIVASLRGSLRPANTNLRFHVHLYHLTATASLLEHATVLGSLVKLLRRFDSHTQRWTSALRRDCYMGLCWHNTCLRSLTALTSSDRGRRRAVSRATFRRAAPSHVSSANTRRRSRRQLVASVVNSDQCAPPSKQTRG